MTHIFWRELSTNLAFRAVTWQSQTYSFVRGARRLLVWSCRSQKHATNDGFVPAQVFPPLLLRAERTASVDAPLDASSNFRCIGTYADAVICPASMSSAIAAGQYGSSRTGSITRMRAWVALCRSLVLPTPSRRLLCHTLLRPPTSPTPLTAVPDLRRDRYRSSVIFRLGE